MPTVKVRRDGTEFEISDITFEQAKELVGVNGYGHHAAQSATSALLQPLPIRSITGRGSDFRGFLDALSDRGRLFVDILKHHPEGIEANVLAGELGFQDSRQIGGLTGGGIARTAKKYGISVQQVYRPEVTFPAGKRTVTLYPGIMILEWGEQQKPAV